MLKVISVQVDMEVKGFKNLRKVIKRDLEGGVNSIIMVASSPEGVDREVKSHSVFGLLDYPVVINKGDDVISLED